MICGWGQPWAPIGVKGHADSQITADELSGYQVFKSLGCITCHQGANVGGNLFQRHGIFHPLGSPEPVLLRVPSLRNVATTAPYFHDGSVATLPEAVKAMGVAQLDRVLTDQQITAIVAFLNTLTGTYRDRAVRPAVAAPRADSAVQNLHADAWSVRPERVAKHLGVTARATHPFLSSI
jgi:cytochrome c peroxidase